MKIDNKKSPLLSQGGFFIVAKIIYKPDFVPPVPLNSGADAAIYLDATLPLRSSGFPDAMAGRRFDILLAAGRVCLSPASLRETVGSYPTRFTLTRRNGRFRFCGTFPKLLG